MLNCNYNSCHSKDLDRLFCFVGNASQFSGQDNQLADDWSDGPASSGASSYN